MNFSSLSASPAKTRARRKNQDSPGPDGQQPGGERSSGELSAAEVVTKLFWHSEDPEHKPRQLPEIQLVPELQIQCSAEKSASHN